jgi:hypothetical protein
MPLSRQPCNTAQNEGLWATRQAPGMSLILDALKKSEQSRVQTVGPLWPSPKPSGQSARVPLWAWALGGLLIVNVLVLLVVFALGSSGSGTTESSTPQVVPKQSGDSLAMLNRDSTAASSASTVVGSSAVTAAPSARSTTVNRGGLGNEASRSSAQSFAAVPSRDSLLAQGATIPTANLTLHVFDPKPRSRFILLDGERLSEGDTSKTGLRVTAITAEGAIFSFGNNTFKVSIQ